MPEERWQANSVNRTTFQARAAWYYRRYQTKHRRYLGAKLFEGIAVTMLEAC